MNFCRRREKHPVLLQNKQNRGYDGSSSHQGQQALWGPRSWRRNSGREDVAAEGGASSSLRCLQSTPRCRRVKVITLQLKIKMSLGREPQHNGSLSDKQRKARALYPLKACASCPISARARVLRVKCRTG